VQKIAYRLAYTLAFGVLAPLSACSGDDGGGDGDDGGGAGGGAVFDDPSDFDHSACDSGTPLDEIDPEGIWHAEVNQEGSRGAAVFRIDPADGGELSALVYGDETDDVRQSAEDLFIRALLGGDSDQVIAIDLCQVENDDHLTGLMAQCFGGECILGTIDAYRMDPLDEPEAEGMSLVSEWRGPEASPWEEQLSLNVRHLGTVAYLVGVTDGLHIVDLADPAAPADLGHLPASFPAEGEFYNDIKVSEAADGRIYAFLASSIRGVVVADVTDPTDPVEVAAFPEPPVGGGGTSVHTLFLEGERLYTATTSRGALQVFDVADPTEAAELGTYVHPEVANFGGFVHDLMVQDGVAYLNYWNLGLVVVDTNDDPSAPALVGRFDDYDRRTSHSNWVTEAGGRSISVHGDEGFDAHVRIVDLDPASRTAFEEIGSYQTRTQVSAHNIMAVGELALVTYYQDGLRVLDLADPTSPVEVAHYASWPGAEPGYGRGFYEGAIGVDHDPERDLILVADTHRGLLVLTLDP
jgi:hypothetical protein